METNVTNNRKLEELSGRMPQAFYENIRRRPDKSFFFELEFTTARNTEFDPNIDRTDPNVFVYSPQINNISMVMPNVPLLTNWNLINQVKINKQT